MNYGTLKVIKLIRKDLTDSKHRVNLFYIAGFHTAILTVLLTVVTTYTLLISGKYKDLEAEVYEQAEQINKLTFLSTSFFPKKKIYSSSKKNTELSNKSICYCHDLGQIFFFGSNLPNHNINLSSKKPHPKDPLVRAELAAGLINIIGHSYPFPKSPLNMNIKKYGWSERRGEAIMFKSLHDVREWLKDLLEINEALAYITYILPSVHPKNIIEVFNPIVEENKIMTEKGHYVASLVML